MANDAGALRALGAAAGRMVRIVPLLDVFTEAFVANLANLRGSDLRLITRIERRLYWHRFGSAAYPLPPFTESIQRHA